MDIYDIPIKIDEISDALELPTKTYALNLNRSIGGKKHISGLIDGLQAVNQAIRKALLTPRFDCLVYDNQYGSEIRKIITANDASPELILTAIPRFVEDALKPDTRILRVYGFAADIRDDSCYIKFNADTIYGETVFEEVL